MKFSRELRNKNRICLHVRAHGGLMPGAEGLTAPLKPCVPHSALPCEKPKPKLVKVGVHRCVRAPGRSTPRAPPDSTASPSRRV